MERSNVFRAKLWNWSQLRLTVSQLAEADPMHLTGKRTFTLRRWLMNEGSLNLALTLSDQRLGMR